MIQTWPVLIQLHALAEMYLLVQITQFPTREEKMATTTLKKSQLIYLFMILFSSIQPIAVEHQSSQLSSLSPSL